VSAKFTVQNTPVAFTVQDSSVTFNVSGIGQQGPQGPSGLPFTRVELATLSRGLALSETGTLFNNLGANAEIDLSLPSTPTPLYPVTFSLYVATNETLSLIVPYGVTISNGSDSSSSGGSISSDTVGNLVTVVLISATQWVVTSIVGVWELN